MKLTLVYPNVPFWRAEVSRLALHLGKVPFENRQPAWSEFTQLRDSGALPFNQLPILIADGETIAQTGAIARYCGKLSGLYPKNNDLLAAQIDQVLDLATDITVLVSTTANAVTGRMDNDQEKIRKRKALSDGELGRKLDILEKNIKPN